jgi:hypothetical protein
MLSLKATFSSAKTRVFCTSFSDLPSQRASSGSESGTAASNSVGSLRPRVASARGVHRIGRADCGGLVARLTVYSKGLGLTLPNQPNAEVLRAIRSEGSNSDSATMWFSAATQLTSPLTQGQPPRRLPGCKAGSTALRPVPQSYWRRRAGIRCTTDGAPGVCVAHAFPAGG